MEKVEFEFKRLPNVLEQTTDSIMITNTEGVIEYVNPAYIRSRGCRPNDILGKKGGSTHIQDTSADFSLKQVHARLEKGEIFQEIRIRRWKNQTPYYEELTVTPIVDEAGKITHYISTGRDITKQIQEQEKLYRLAYYDLLTQLPNRALFLDRFTHALAGMRNGVKTLGVLYLDLDRFKNVNDSHGHDAGDKLLIAYAKRLVESLREVDTIARLSGDEFIILLEGMTSIDDIDLICRKILKTLSQPFSIDAHEHIVTTSIGVSIYPRDGREVSVLMKCADIAMYRAKRAGRHTFKFYTPEMGKNGMHDSEMEARANYDTTSGKELKRIGR